MPVFDLKCSGCEEEIRDWFFHNQAEDPPDCPKCKTPTMVRQFVSSYAIKMDGNLHRAPIKWTGPNGTKCELHPEVKEYNPKTQDLKK
jgi:putative FmdB family regulatory protein